MLELLGTTWPVFFGMTVFVMRFAAFMTGQELANGWRPIWQVVLYCAMLGGADRFLVFALFQGKLFLFSGYLIDTVVLIAIGLASYRFTLGRRMVAQYPWIYERIGPFGWRKKESADKISE
jgi:hypothetical protein